MSKQERERELAEKAVDARMRIIMTPQRYRAWRAEQDARERVLRMRLPRG